jgi:hypothetical protein
MIAALLSFELPKSSEAFPDIQSIFDYRLVGGDLATLRKSAALAREVSF